MKKNFHPRLYVVCTVTLTVLRVYAATHPIRDFVLLDEPEAKHFELMLIVEEGPDLYLELRSSSSFHLNYRLRVRFGISLESS